MKGLLTLLLSFILLHATAQINRSYDGNGNNVQNPNWGNAHGNFSTIMRTAFGDSISTPGGQNLPNPRDISNAVGSQSRFMPNELGLSDMVWGWGQFIDHDINLGDDNLGEANDIPVPNCEPMFDPNCTGSQTLRMFRSKSDVNSGTSASNPRKFVNEITSFIDGSLVYGSDAARADWLRSKVDGKLKMSSGNLLPWNTIDGEFNSPIDSTTVPFMVVDGHPKPTKFFIAGDVRANEQPGLAAFHTLWVREHNRLCDELKAENPNWNDEQLYQRARKIVGALIQVITYEEFLKSMGIQLDPYSGYDNTVDATIMNTFSAAAYRFGHTLVNGRLVRFEENGDSLSFGAVDLRNGFFNPSILKDEGGLSPFFRGFAAQKHQIVDPLIMDDLRNFLFGPPGSGGIDLLSINIARARERGVPTYNFVLLDLGLPPHKSFSSLTSNDTIRNSLSSVYNSADDVDPWVGFMSEDHLPNSIVGRGLHEILKRQFQALRDGDRYYYEHDPAFTAAQRTELKNTMLSDVILRNTAVQNIQDSVFIAVPRHLLSVELFPFREIRNIHLSAYPNPVQKYFNLRIENSRPTQAVLRIFDVNGSLVREEGINLQRGTNEYNFELEDDLANGLYTIILSSESGSGQLKIVKQQ